MDSEGLSITGIHVFEIAPPLHQQEAPTVQIHFFFASLSGFTVDDFVLVCLKEKTAFSLPDTFQLTDCCPAKILQLRFQCLH